MKKITIFVIVVLLLAVTAVPGFAHPDASDGGLATAEGEAGTSPVGNNISPSSNIPQTAVDNLEDHNPLCGLHPAPGGH